MVVISRTRCDRCGLVNLGNDAIDSAAGALPPIGWLAYRLRYGRPQCNLGTEGYEYSLILCPNCAAIVVRQIWQSY